MESLLKGKEFSVGQVLRSTVEVCHGNYKQFFIINVLVIMTGMLSSIINTVITAVTTNPIIMILGSLGVMCIAIVAFYFTARISIVQYFSVNDYINKTNRSFGEKYKIAGEVVWRYIGTSLLIGLMALGFYIVMGIIIGVVAVVSINSEFTGIRILIMSLAGIVCLIGITVIGVKFYLAILVRIFDRDHTTYFKESASLVRGNFFKVLWLYMIPALIQGPIIGVLLYLSLQQMINQFVYMGGAMAVSIVVGPYISCGIVIIYLLLRASKVEEPLEVLEVTM